MLVSHNEIIMLGRKLFEALGFAAGDIEDAADMVAWNELHGIPALAHVHRDLANLRPYQHTLRRTRQEPLILEFDAQGQSCLHIGTLAADAGYQAAIEQGILSVSVRNCYHQSLLVPYLIKVAQRGINVSATWFEPVTNTKPIAVIHANSPLPVFYHSRNQRPIPPPSLPSASWLNITIAARDTLTPRNSQLDMFEIIDSAALAHRFVHHRDNGIRVDPQIWADLTQVTKQVLVAASAESRRGAGE